MPSAAAQVREQAGSFDAPVAAAVAVVDNSGEVLADLVAAATWKQEEGQAASKSEESCVDCNGLEEQQKGARKLEGSGARRCGTAAGAHNPAGSPAAWCNY